MTGAAYPYGPFISEPLFPRRTRVRDPNWFPMPAKTIHCPRPESVARSFLMLDIAFLVIGAVFLGACVLYTLACDRL